MRAQARRQQAAARERPDPIMNNVFRNEILSETWCNLIFEGRNKEYGAYRLRAEAGSRYRRALVGLAVVVGLMVAVFAYRAVVNYIILKSLEGDMPTARLKPLKPEEGHEFKAIAAGRSNPLPAAGPNASVFVPEICDTVPPAPPEFGIEGPKVLETEEQTFVRLPDDSARHNVTQEDLPVEGEPLTPVQVVEEMPQFPGGLKALMAFLDEHLEYPAACLKSKLSADVEVAFYVDKSGKVTEPTLTKRKNAEFDRAALDVVRKMPDWKPGKVGGKVSVVRVRLPIHFQYQ